MNLYYYTLACAYIIYICGFYTFFLYARCMSKRTHALFPRRLPQPYFHRSSICVHIIYTRIHKYIYIYVCVFVGYANRHYYNLLSCPVGKISYSGNTKRQFVLTASVFPGLSPSEYKWPRIYLYI